MFPAIQQVRGRCFISQASVAKSQILMMIYLSITGYSFGGVKYFLQKHFNYKNNMMSLPESGFDLRVELELRLVRHCYTSSTKPVSAEDRSQSSDINKYRGKYRTFFLAERSIRPCKYLKIPEKGERDFLSFF